MKKQMINVQDSVGKILCHDMTAIIPGVFKGPRFKKGHMIRQEDVNDLLLMGKKRIYIIELGEDDVHEDEAGLILGRGTAGPGVVIMGPVESKVNLISEIRGVLKVNVSILEKLNYLEDVIIATLPSNRVVEQGEKVASTKVIPLVVHKNIILQAREIMKEGPMVQVKPFIKKKVSLIITGGEIYSNKIKDSFSPVLTDKINALGSEVTSLDFVKDDAIIIKELIIKNVVSGADIVMVTGGMSVDPDDVTPEGIKMSGAEIVKYGVPILPGAMFMIGYIGETAVMGVPACGMYYRTSILDLILPRIIAGEKISKNDLIGIAHGGLCRSCEICRFPMCSFGA